ncbi:MAG: hypothetical protein EPN43_10355 [Jatrophihabitans sp.]|nr:MAG: hypothetical protein EPN43_10355 [Jatrophihabitans sp.]
MTTTTTKPRIVPGEITDEQRQLLARIDTLSPDELRRALQYLIGWAPVGVRHAFEDVTRAADMRAALESGDLRDLSPRAVESWTSARAAACLAGVR